MEEVTVTGLAEVMTKKNVRVLDVPNPDEYGSGHVPGAELITMATFALGRCVPGSTGRAIKLSTS